MALGDSLAAGVGARRGYVPRYAEHLQSDTGARLRVINLGQARSSYQSGTCGGLQNEACLHEVVDRAERNWDAIISEISSLRSTENTIVRTVGLGYIPRTEALFGPYLGSVTRHIASSAAAADITYVEVRLADEDMSEDGLHPNNKGYQVIAGQLRSLGYEPLYPR